MFIAAVHDLSKSGPPLRWEKDRWGDLVAPCPVGGCLRLLTGEVVWQREKECPPCVPVASVEWSPTYVARDWARGIPSLLVDGDETEDLLVWIAEAVAPHLIPTPRFLASRQGRIPPGFRGRSSTPPWKWDPETRAQCECAYGPRLHRAVPSSHGTCGFYGALSPFDVTPYIEWGRPFIAVCAPFGRVVLHTRVWRAERYDVAAIVVPLDTDVPPDDPRIVRARNLPLRAWEIANELLAFADLPADTETPVG
jgi:hypothetical protein